MDSYFNKYLKYKNKYLSLRNLYGGVNPPVEEAMAAAVVTPPVVTPPVVTPPVVTPPVAEAAAAVAGPVVEPVGGNLIMLSEIANFTKQIFIRSNIVSERDRLAGRIETRVRISIFLNDIFNSIPNFINTYYLENKSGFYQDPLIQFYNINNNKYHNYINHIGETNSTNRQYSDRVFPPDRNYINIQLHERIITNPNGSKEDRGEFIKGGNFIASPATPTANHGVLFYIEPITVELKEILDREVIQKKVPISCSFKYNGRYKDPFSTRKISTDMDLATMRRVMEETMIKSDFRHIDEIMTFLPYGFGKFKIWIYDIKDTPQFSRERYIQLKEEQIENLNRISIALFETPYLQNKKSFFIVPIDITFPVPPIFNLTYIESRDLRIDPQLFLSSRRAGELDQIIIDE